MQMHVQQFPRSVNSKVWKTYLGRNLTPKEYHLLSQFRTEIAFNKQLNVLHDQCDQGNMFIPCLPDMDGNCLFNSLIEHGIGETVESLRIGLATVMYTFQNYNNFIPETKMTLKEMFDLSNDIEYVGTYNRETGERKFYKYTYNVMCQDLSNVNSWSKLPTELILRVISVLYKGKIHIVHPDTKWISSVDSFENCDIKPEMQDLHLGLLGETHYVPISEKREGFTYRRLVYEDAKNDFKLWAFRMEKLKSQRPLNIPNYFI